MKGFNAFKKAWENFYNALLKRPLKVIYVHFFAPAKKRTKETGCSNAADA